MSVHEQLPDYLLGLLEPQEKTLIEGELEASPELRTELEELRKALFGLPLALVAVAPPPRVWGKVQARTNSRRLWLRVAAAAAVLAILWLGSFSINQYVNYRNLRAEQDKVAQWLAIPKAKWRSFGTEGKIYGTMIWINGRCLVVMKNPPPKGKTYQVWGRKEDNVPISLGVFGNQVFETRYQGFVSMGVSLEPPGGSPKPTMPLGRVPTS